MKKITFLLLITLTALKTMGQSPFVFDGDGNWTDVTQWADGNYPGITIGIGDTVQILGKLTISENTIVTNNGTIESMSTQTTTPEINILGALVNYKTIEFGRTQILVEVGGKIIMNDTSELDVNYSSNLTNRGNINVLGGTINLGSVSSIINDGTFRNRGTVKVYGGTFENKLNASNTNLGSVNNKGLFEITGGEVINRGDFIVEVDGILVNKKTFTNDVTGRINNSGQITITDFSSALINRGTLINLKNINIEAYSTINMVAGSTFINQETGSVEVDTDGKVINAALQFAINGGKLTNNGTIENNATLTIGALGELENNGKLNIPYSSEISNSGILSGINTEHNATFTNGGILSPGNSNDATGFYKLDGFFTNYSQTVDGSLNIDLGGFVAGDTYDQLIVPRDATLDGTLNVSLVSGFEPSVGDVFTILFQTRNIFGTFTTVNLPTLSGNKKWGAVEYSNADGVRISVEFTLSVPDVSMDSLKIRVYPNPSSDKIFVSGISNSSNAYVFDLNGRKLMETKLSKENSSIDVSTLPIGVYLLNIEGVSFKFARS